MLGFPDDPGAPHRHYRTAGAYPGAHRPITAILFANDTWGGRFDWLVHGDDDTMLYLPEDARLLAGTPPATPLLLGHNAPRTPKQEPVCRAPARRARPWRGCCLRERDDEPFGACPVEVARGDARYYERGGGEDGELEPVLGCGTPEGRERFCCPVSRGASDANRTAAGFPYALDTEHGESPYSFVRAWVFGGDGYVLSAGLLAAIGRPRWKECDEMLLCGNADMRVVTCVFNSGFMYSSFGAHHVGKHSKDWRRRAHDRRRASRV